MSVRDDAPADAREHAQPGGLQAAFWNGAAGDRWVRAQELLDAWMKPFSDAVLTAAHAAAGEAIVDVGCGCGDTSLVLADAVGSSGRVVGVDVSEPMLARASERARERGVTNASFALGDAAAHPFEPRAYDLIFSRFGVMFFGDAVAAFAHLREALKEGGRVAFVCWRALTANPWALVPAQATASALAEDGVALPPPAPPGAPGPFAFGEHARVRAVLGAAGFRDVVLRPIDALLRMGASEQPSVDEAADFVMQFGPTSRMLDGQTPETIAHARDAIRRALALHAGAAGVRLGGACWLVTATHRT